MSTDSIREALKTTPESFLAPGKTMKRAWCGLTSDGDRVTALELSDGVMTMQLLSYGARLGVLTRSGTPLTLTLDTIADLEADGAYLGASIGRVTNRIKNATFELNGEVHKITTSAKHALHGGEKGWDSFVWAIEKVGLNDSNNIEVVFSRTSPTGEMGFPGAVFAKATYTLTQDSVTCKYEATGLDQPTPINMTNHSYWSLSAGTENVLETHAVKYNVDKIMCVDDDLIPTGSFDTLGDEFHQENGKLINELRAEGFDHFFMGSEHKDLQLMITVLHPSSGKKMEVYSDQVGFQMFTGPGSGPYHLKGIALEASGPNDASNNPNFPQITLQPGETRVQTTCYKFY
mmetsp:Transcript_10477/g.32013  ORF Transcript_10477/g.32013 Transcript_10477/m.32013 type:complete len:346 (+) Transcript_10477:146-1183(+)